MSDLVRIIDVSPRDGLQNEPRVIPVADKVRLVELLARSGLDEIEVSSFVSPKWIPQLGDAAEVFRAAAAFKPDGMLYSALVPNEKGMQAARAVNDEAGRRVIDKVSVFTAASETFARRNTNASIAETLERFEPVFRAARQGGLASRGYISCAVACPFEGAIHPQALVAVARRLAALGADEIDVADTIGAGTPARVAAMLGELIAGLGDAWLPRITLHLHDTFGQAGACAAEALRLGIRSFDAAAGGLGGCPYASTADRRAPGNLSTERLVGVIRSAGLSCRVDSTALGEAALFARGLRGATLA